MRTKGIRRDNGQALVEFTLLIPVLLFVVLAIAQFGGLYNHYVTITDTTRGARMAVGFAHGHQSDRARHPGGARLGAHARPESAQRDCESGAAVDERPADHGHCQLPVRA